MFRHDFQTHVEYTEDMMMDGARSKMVMDEELVQKIEADEANGTIVIQSIECQMKVNEIKIATLRARRLARQG